MEGINLPFGAEIFKLALIVLFISVIIILNIKLAGGFDEIY